MVTSDQQNLLSETQTRNGNVQYQQNIQQEVGTTDTLQFNTSGAIVAAGKGSAAAIYRSADSSGNCYSRVLTSTNQALTSVTDSKKCQ